jgi:hypothetical protein
MRFYKDPFIRIGTDAALEACVHLDQIGALSRVRWTLSSVRSGPTPRSRHAFYQSKSGPNAASSGLRLRSDQDRRHALGVRLLRPNQGLKPHQADFNFGQIVTDATLGRALTPAKSGPQAASSGLQLRSNRDRRHAPGVRLLRPNRGLWTHQADFNFGRIVTDAMLQACAYSGQIVALGRIKRTSTSVKS